VSAEKRKGDAFERAVIAELRTHGIECERTLRLGAHDDRGDIEGVEGWHLDCKARARFDLSGWVDEVVREAGALLPAVVVKRRGKSAAHAYVVIELQTFAELLPGRVVIEVGDE
jgi:hypothetical protein